MCFCSNFSLKILSLQDSEWLPRRPGWAGEGRGRGCVRGCGRGPEPLLPPEAVWRPGGRAEGGADAVHGGRRLSAGRLTGDDDDDDDMMMMMTMIMMMMMLMI